MTAFPKTIRVVQNGKGDDMFLMTIEKDRDLDEFDGEPIAIYERKNVGRIQVTREIVAA